MTSAMHNKIVVKYKNGKMLKGVSRDFFPNRDMFHLTLGSLTESGETLEVDVNELKAIFFVKDFGGKKEYNEKKDFELLKMLGKKMKVKFIDGEEVWGYVQAYSPESKGFFLFPSDPNSNNVRIYILNKSVQSVNLVG